MHVYFQLLFSCRCNIKSIKSWIGVFQINSTLPLSPASPLAAVGALVHSSGHNFFVYLTHLFIGESEDILVSAVVLRHVSVSTLPLLLQVDARHQEVEHHRRIEVGIELGKDLGKQTEKR